VVSIVKQVDADWTDGVPNPAAMLADVVKRVYEERNPGTVEEAMARAGVKPDPHGPPDPLGPGEREYHNRITEYAGRLMRP